MKLSTAFHATAFIASAMICGCSSAQYAEVERRAVTSAPSFSTRASSVLLGSSERAMFEEMDTETEGYAPPKPKRSGFAIRAGMLALDATDDVSYDTAVSFGLAYDILDGKSLDLELSADTSSVADTTGERTSTLILLGAAARYAPGGGSFYLVGGASFVTENYTDELTGVAESASVSLFGAGLGFRPGGFDLRVGYSMPLAGGGPGALAASGGYAF